ncbi:MAG: ribonuclease HII [Gammaproteobacteria bacterium]|nr:ribonuclease HII [Gammaproteobacteria bacterium]
MLIAGVDEAGRGPLAGPVVAAAVILEEDHGVSGLKDSKQLTPLRRETLAGAIRDRAVAWALGVAEAEEIDRVNILQASLAAMSRAVAALGVPPQRVLVDGNRAPRLPCEVRAVVGGDRRIAVVSAASILAKVARDGLMTELDRMYPEYGFARHKGYPTAAHRAALARYGPCPVHRRSFSPVRAALALERGNTR